MWKMETLPAEYRLLSPLEASLAPDALTDVIQVHSHSEWVPFINEDGVADFRAEPVYEYAIPAAYPVMWKVRDDGSVYDCVFEFDEHTDHKECAYTMALMNTDPFENYDPMDWIPAGTPDSWIPDNPDDNGMRMSDFI